MNRLVLIGNGFDLAHRLNTSYVDFINWYWKSFGEKILQESTNEVSDILCSFTLKPSQYYLTWPQLWSGNHLQRKGNEVVDLLKAHPEFCHFKYKSHFFEQINKSIETKRWVDIEREYYRHLARMATLYSTIDFQGLNKQLEFLRDKLIEYLKKETDKETAIIESIESKIYCNILNKEIDVNYDKAHRLDISWGGLGQEPSNIMLLNFNYTSTPELYTRNHQNVSINYIHGQLTHPESVIFGYGDELDKEFPHLKEIDNNECLRHVKSINYVEADNYRKMREFIESDLFQVVIMGHSCGNSDRTLLNRLFEHPNCVSVKPYYYIKEDGTDNYNELVQNIYRNFTDMNMMRDRVVSKVRTEPLCS